MSFINENIFGGSAVSKISFKLSTRKSLERVRQKSVQSKRTSFTEMGFRQGIHRCQSSPFSKNEYVIKVWPILNLTDITSQA